MRKTERDGAKERNYLTPSSGEKPSPYSLFPEAKGAALPYSQAPLYHPNLLIVGTRLTHGGFLFQLTHIEKTEDAKHPVQPVSFLSITLWFAPTNTDP